MPPQPTTLLHTARKLRRNQTDAESKLWTRLRSRQMEDTKFRRQHPVGPFITDFCCPEKGLVIELDGSQYLLQTEADHKRSQFLLSQGYDVLRFWNNEVLEDIDAVLERIAEVLRNPHPSPLPRRAREEE